jgi:polysaccharide deacetylase family protein (PEP-CTERM system associated)
MVNRQSTSGKRDLTSREGEAASLPGGSGQKNLLTVVVEDYFHVAPLKSVVQADRWYRFERRVETNTRKALDLLDEYNICATFFILGSIADEMPELVREIFDRGHEVASKGYFHHSIGHFSRDEFRDDVARSRDALERAAGSQIHGFRIGHQWFDPDDLWALDVLAKEGFTYDSSIRPLFGRFSQEPWRRRPHRNRVDGGEIWEFPLTSWTMMGWSVPISGGNYFRQLPHWMIRRAVASWVKEGKAPFLMYFHVWELDPDQPRILAAPWKERVRQYRNLDRMEGIVRYYLENYEFSGIADALGLPRVRDEYLAEITGNDHPSAVHFVEGRTPVTVVIPCFNEELILPYLAKTLKNLERAIRDRYDVRFIFVDDGSVDGTWVALRQIFGDREDCVLERHAKNRGVAAAILTGIDCAETDIVCSIDCDCTYDPLQLENLLPKLSEGIDMVTGSPYHPDGQVRNVPRWRLFLSKSLSELYGLVLNQRLATYTSCFRVYRRSSVVELNIREGGFLGVAEMLGRLDLSGGRIVECPAVLEVRLLGRSKMKTVRTIFGHLRLLARLGVARIAGAGAVDPGTIEISVSSETTESVASGEFPSKEHTPIS